MGWNAKQKCTTGDEFLKCLYITYNSSGIEWFFVKAHSFKITITKKISRKINILKWQSLILKFWQR